MKTTYKTLIAMLTVAASGIVLIPAAHAAHPNDSAYPPAKKSDAPGKTRAEVKTELKQAYEQGKLPIVDSQYPVLKDANQPKTREQVKKELNESKRDGEKQRLNQELYSG